jgi:CheY-like chemotaxis protein
VVDDQPEVLAVLTALLEAAGAEVAPSSDPADVVEALRDYPNAWDLLITDYDMPGMTGADLAKAARDQAPGLPVILVTALAGLAGRSKGLFDAVLSKPLDREALVRSAEAAILRRKLTG